MGRVAVLCVLGRGDYDGSDWFCVDELAVRQGLCGRIIMPERSSMNENEITSEVEAETETNEVEAPAEPSEAPDPVLAEETDNICEIFSITPWADGLSVAERQYLSGYLKLTTYPQGEVILKEGRREAYMCIIVAGQVDVVKDDYKKKKSLTTLNKGKSFGEMSLLDGEPRSATIIASEQTTVLVLKKNSLDKLIKDDPVLGSKFLLKLGKTLSRRLRLMDGKVLDMS